MSSNVLSFVEESCFSGETFRSVRRQINFTLTSYGNRLGLSLKSDFLADFGLYYDYTEVFLRDILAQNFGSVDWDDFVFHNKIDHSGIDVIEVETTKVVGSIHVRRSSNLKLPGEILGANVITWAKVLEWRDKREREAEASDQG